MRSNFIPRSTGIRPAGNQVHLPPIHVVYIPSNFPPQLMSSLQQHISHSISPTKMKPQRNLNPVWTGPILASSSQKINEIHPISSKHNRSLSNHLVLPNQTPSTIKKNADLFIDSKEPVNKLQNPKSLAEKQDKERLDGGKSPIIVKEEDQTREIQNKVAEKEETKNEFSITEIKAKDPKKKEMKRAQLELLKARMRKNRISRTFKHAFNHDYDDSYENLPGFKDFVEAFNKACQKEKNFIDPTFPHNDHSIISSHKSLRKEKWAGKFVWERPLKGQYHIFKTDMTPENASLFTTSFRHRRLARKLQDFETAIDIDDIVQGELGNCYFLSSLSSLAENPKRIRNLFISKRITEKCGIYCVRICHEGEWRAVYVDDYLPVYADGRGFCFSKSKQGENELWVPLLEKAWAKLYGGYENIEAGLTRDVLRDLTGAPTKVVWNDDPNIWDEIVDGEVKDYIMTAGAVDSFEKVKNSAGMVVGHAYSLISVVEVNGHKLVKLRNPWGSGEWKGAWSDFDPVWNTVSEKKKNKIGFSVEDDGCFFMSFEDFRAIYDSVQICMIDVDKKYDSIRLFCGKNQGCCIEIEAKKDGDYCFTVLQPSCRKMFPNEKYDAGSSTIILAKREGENLVFVDGHQIAHRENFVDCKGLKAGVYVAFTKITWVGVETNDFIFSSYGTENVSLKRIKKVEGFLEKVYLSKADKQYEVFVKEGYGYYLMENKEEKSVKRRITFNSLIGLKLKKKVRSEIKNNVLEIVIPAKTNKLILFKLEGRNFDLNVTDVSIAE